MALTKETIVDKIEVIESGIVQVRTATRVLEDGVQISEAYHRHTVNPSERSGEIRDADRNITTPATWGDTDISGEDARVQAICTATWTAEVKTAYQESVEAQEAAV
tara:strand:+ start:505 stop:822 length:318 start_codon:yes stop_codon:yes gene_type:complete